MNKPAELRALAARVEAAAHAAVTSGTAIAIARTSVAFTHIGDPAAATSLLALLESRGDSPVFSEPLVAAHAASARAMVALLAGDAGATIEWMLEAIHQFEVLGDRRNATAQRVNAAYAYVEVGKYEEAEIALREVLVVADRMGLESVSAAAKQNLGLALTHLGKHEEARQVEEDSIEAFRLQKRPRMEDGSSIYLAHVLARGGHLDEALEIAVRITSRDDLSPTFRAYALAVLAHVRLLRDENEAALEAARAAHDQLEGLKSVDEGESMIRLVWAEALYANGREDEARLAIASAERRLEDRAARMTNPAIRESFLTQVPENALTLELAHAWNS
jgi:tetratricopeptide (TPR) repeat protein